jgi:hypothetical protein
MTIALDELRTRVSVRHARGGLGRAPLELDHPPHRLELRHLLGAPEGLEHPSQLARRREPGAKPPTEVDALGLSPQIVVAGRASRLGDGLGDADLAPVDQGIAASV